MIEVCSKKFTSVSSLIDYEMEKQLGGMKIRVYKIKKRNKLLKN